MRSRFLFNINRNRTLSNYRIKMVEMDQIVRGKGGWVDERKPNLQGSAIALTFSHF